MRKPGTGKTSTSLLVVHHFKPKKGFYTAYNKSIVVEAQEKFPTNMECKTKHAFALSWIKPKNRIEPFTYLCIKEKLSYPVKKSIMDIMNSFFLSASTDMEEYISALKDSKLEKIAIKYINQMINDEIPPTFDFLLKYLHLLLDQELLEIKYDLAVLDECFTGDTLVATDTHDRSIRSICNSLKKGEEVFVKSFNNTTELFEYKKASNPLISTNRKIVEIKTEGLNKLHCTPNHRILTQRGYIRADKLIPGNDYILLDSPQKQKTKNILNSEQYQVMLGSYLGDGCLQKQSNYNTYRLSFTQSDAQLNYMKWKTDAFNLTNTLRKGKSGYTGKHNIWQSNTSPTFILKDNPFNLVLKDITALGLAIWIMDDGASTYKGKSIQISTGNLTLQQVTLIMSMLQNKFNLTTSKYLDKRNNCYTLMFGVKATIILKQIIQPYIHNDVAYKFNIKTTQCITLNNQYKTYGGNFVTSVTPSITNHTVYDFEVEDNHNFLVSHSKNATKSIVHNCQDTTAVFYEIFKLIKCNKKLIVGDPFQNIYGYMNTVNAFNLLDDVSILPLTKTFRCSPEIAKRVQTYGRTHLSDSFKYEGVGTNITDDTIAYIGRTNGSILMRIYDIIEEGKSFTLTRPVKEILALPMALANVSNGREIYHKQYKYLEKEYQQYTISGMKSFYTYLMKHVEDEELHACIKFMNVLREKNINIFQLKKDIENMVFNPKVWVVTAHSFKG